MVSHLRKSELNRAERLRCARVPIATCP